MIFNFGDSQGYDEFRQRANGKVPHVYIFIIFFPLNLYLCLWSCLSLSASVFVSSSTLMRSVECRYSSEHGSIDHADLDTEM